MSSVSLSFWLRILNRFGLLNSSKSNKVARHQGMQAVEISLQDLFAKKAAYCFLAGSGVSIDPPSNLPTGYQFTQTLLKKILPQEYVDATLALTDPNRQNKKAHGHFLRFEQLMGFLKESIDPELHVLDCLAESTQPNFNHLFLASLIEKGSPVFTTNFDSLIEYALMRLGIDKSRITPVIHRSTWENEPIQGLPVYKLHGSLMDCCSGADTRSSVQATIENIVQQKIGDTFVPEAWKMAPFRRELQTRDLVIFGYSGLDDFDIVPALRSIRTDKRLIWVSHAEDIALDNALIQCPSDPLTTGETLDYFGAARQSRHVVPTLASTGARNRAALFEVHVNTRSLIAFLSQHWAMDVPPASTLSSDNAPHLSAARFESLQTNVAQRWLLLGDIWFAHGDLEQALIAYTESVSCSEEGNDPESRALALSKTATILESRGRLDEALHCLNLALQLDTLLADMRGMALRLNRIGFILYGQGRFEESEQNFKRSLSLCEVIGNRQGKADNLNKIASFLIAQDKTADALEHCKEALAIAREVGDISGTAACLTTIGFIHKTCGELDQAMITYQAALDVHEQIGDLSGKLTLLNNIGNVHNVSGRYGEALKYFEHALELNEPLGDMNMKANMLGNIANVWYRQRQLAKALKFYKQSHSVFRKHGYAHQAYLVMMDIEQIKTELKTRR